MNGRLTSKIKTKIQTISTPQEIKFGKGISGEIQFTKGETPTKVLSKFEYLELPKKQPDIESHLYRANRAIRNSEKIIQRNIEKSIAMKPVVSEKVVEVIRPKPKIRT